jgi:retron-type reverse transcriptase
MLPQFKNVHDLLIAFPDKLNQAAGTSGTSITKLRRLAVDGAAKIRREMIKCASACESGVPRLARNLTATTSPAGAEVLAILLEHWAATEPFEPLNEHHALLEAITAQNAASDVIGWLLAGGKAPAYESVSVFFGGNLRACLLFELGAKPSPKSRTAADTARFLKNRLGPRPEKTDDDDYLTFVKDGFAKGLAPIQERDFKKLPVRIRQWILANTAFIKAALAPPLRDLILADPKSHPDTPDARASAKWAKDYPVALQNLRAGRFLTAAVHEILKQDKLSSEVIDEILVALHQGMKIAEKGDGQQCLPFQDSYIRHGAPRLVSVLVFFSHSHKKRLSTVRDLPPARIRQLVHDVSRVEWIAALLRCSDIDSLKTLRPRILKERWQRDELLSRLGETTTSTECLSVFWKDALTQGHREMVASLADANPFILGQIEPDEIGRPAIRRLLASHLKDEVRFLNFISWGEESVTDAVMTTCIPGIRVARDTLLRIARVSENSNFRMTVLWKALVIAPSTLVKNSGSWLSDDEFDVLLQRSLKPEGLSALFQLKVKGGGYAWEKCFRLGKSITAIRRVVRKHLPELSSRLKELEADRLLKRPGFKSDLCKVLAGKASAGSLGAPQKLLRYLIPWARQRWRKKPTLAVANELALAFSVADARYLAFLCTERWKSPEKDRGGYVFDHHYRVYSLPKKSGGSRLVTVPSDVLKRLQRRILRSGLDEIFVHPAAHGFRAQRSILTNALPHAGHPCVVNVDISSFFPSTRYPLIFSACSLLAGGVLSEAACHVLADICSYGGGLPTGAPTSPALANLVLRSADTSIAKAARSNNITYTRYADDLTFSGESNVVKILPFVSRVLGQIGYQLDAKKTNIFRRGRRQMVTGLVVNVKPNLPRRIRRRLRAAVHHAVNGKQPTWQGGPMSKSGLLARLGHLALVQPVESAALRQLLKGSGNNGKSMQ